MFSKILSHRFLAFWVICGIVILKADDVGASVFGDYIASGGGGRDGINVKEPVPEYLRSVVDCHLGEPHRHYPECRCGERVEIVRETEIPPESRGDYHVRVKHTRRGIRNIYYHCLFCSQCPDGVKTLLNCSRMVDTQCTSSCIRSTDYFDKGRKACVPDPMLVEPTTRHTATTVDPGNNELESVRSGTDRPQALQSSDNIRSESSLSRSTSFLADDKLFLIVAGVLVIAVIVVLVLNVFTCRYLYLRRKDDQEKQAMLPKTTSRASMTMYDDGREMIDDLAAQTTV